MWLKEVHGKAYPKKNSEEMAIEALKRALEADDIGYYYLKWGILTILWSFASFILTLKSLGFCLTLVLFLLVGILLTLTMVGTYKVTHHRKSWRESFRKFFIRKPLFPS
jgi:succinate-acetate transporter protein